MESSHLNTQKVSCCLLDYDNLGYGITKQNLLKLLDYSIFSRLYVTKYSLENMLESFSNVKLAFERKLSNYIYCYNSR